MKLEYDLKKLYMDVFAPQMGEKITFITEYPENENKVTEHHEHLQEMTALWHGEMCELADLLDCEVKSVISIEIQDPSPGTFKATAIQNGVKIDLNEVMDQWDESDIIIAITKISITGELMRRLGVQKFRFASAPGVRVDFEGFKANYSLIPLRFEYLVSRMAKAVSAEMTFRLEDLKWKCSFDLRGQRYLYPENGCARRPGEFVNLPSGCANVQPYPGLEGDCRGESLTEGEIPAIIDNNLVVYRIDANKIVEIIGDSEAAETERQHILESGDPTLSVITKIGLGVNDEARCNGTHVGDEKTMGMHWGYGPKKHFPDTIWMEHPIDLDIDFHYPDGSCESIMRSSCYSCESGELF